MNKADQENLLLFDDSEAKHSKADKLVSYQTSLTYTDNGWLPCKVFVVNRSDRTPATFVYSYEAASLLSIGAALGLLALNLV